MQPAPAGELPRWRARMYTLPSRQVWDTALATFKQLGIGVKEVDRDAQAAFTSMTDLDRRMMPVPDMPSPYLPRSVQFHVFVSPFVEPARVYIGSVVKADNRLEPHLSGFVYGVRALEDWLFARLEARLGQTGHAMPDSAIARAALARSLGGPPPVDGCGTDPPPHGPITEPLPIKITRVQPIYPGKEGYVPAAVTVMATLLEDGAIVEARPLANSGPTVQYAQSAVEAVRLWRYRPTRLGECPIQTVMTVQVNFHPR